MHKHSGCLLVKTLAEKFDANGLPMMNDTDSLFDTLNQPARRVVYT